MATTFDAPDWLLNFAQFDWGIQKAGTQFRSPFNGSLQAGDFLAERWVISVTLPPRARADAGAVEAFINVMVGGVNRVRLPHMASGTKPARRVPRGTLRGTPTLRADIARGDTVLPLQAVAGETIKAGDMLGCNSQLYQVFSDATADGTGALDVVTVNRVRGAAALGAAVVWDAPTSLFVMPTMAARHSHTAAILRSGQFDLEEYY